MLFFIYQYIYNLQLNQFTNKWHHLVACEEYPTVLTGILTNFINSLDTLLKF